MIRHNFFFHFFVAGYFKFTYKVFSIVRAEFQSCQSCQSFIYNIKNNTSNIFYTFTYPYSFSGIYAVRILNVSRVKFKIK